ncbi:hypothetical protein JYU34_009117 [Plutella xylostella]|uniref:Malate dehydrogenase, mitochondrial n=1 Tax=Plutella xylostella TaxID=51655 RepID=A0ABQ7QN63_PLUXY|nr:hypothetical protein JYU34_009117 [Plutella xylostella]
MATLVVGAARVAQGLLRARGGTVRVPCGARGVENFVTSPTFAQLDQYCERVCHVTRVPPQKVTVIGAGSPVGRIACLFLKQQPLIKVLSMFDYDEENNVIGEAQDIAHIDTSTRVEAYQGIGTLMDAVCDADVVLICGGPGGGPGMACERQLFLQNMAHVHAATRAAAERAPHAVLAVQTPPLDCNFALVMHTLKLLKKYDARRVLGVNAISAMRANQLLASITGSEPGAGAVPVVGGGCRCTRVPVFASKAAGIPRKQLEHMSELVRGADDIICRVKGRREEAPLSTGFATARFVTNVVQGLFSRPTTIDSALVEQGSPDSCYGLAVCATPVMVGAAGVQQYMVPALSEAEKALLESSKCDLENLLSLGRCHATGEPYRPPRCRYQPSSLAGLCPDCLKTHAVV